MSLFAHVLQKSRIAMIIVPLAFASTVSAQSVEKSPYPQFTRQSWAHMQDISSTKRLSHRLFYKPSEGPNAAWFDAVKRGDLATIKQMVDKGQNIEVKDSASLDQTALGWAAFIGYLDVVEYLVGKGANLMATDKADVQHALKSAILGGNISVITYLYPLLKNKINLNAQDERDGETALMVAASNNRIAATQFLLEQGANPNIVAMVKNTNAYDHDALTYACAAGNLEVARILVQYGAINHKTGKPACSPKP